MLKNQCLVALPPPFPPASHPSSPSSSHLLFPRTKSLFPYCPSDIFFPLFKQLLSSILSSLFHPVDKSQICIFSLPVSSPRIQLHSAQTRCWWRPPNITWRSVTHSCRTSTHSSTKPTPRGRPLFVPSCTSKSFKNVESVFSRGVQLDWAAAAL